MNNYKMLLIAMSLIIAACNQVEESKPVQDNKPNVIILYIDDLGHLMSISWLLRVYDLLMLTVLLLPVHLPDIPY